MILLALWACGAPDPVSTAENFQPYAGPPGRSLEFVPSDAPDQTPLLLEVAEDGGAWETRWGARWADAEPRDTFVVVREAGLFVAESQLLPEKISIGATGDGVELIDMDAHTVWYGTFDDTAIAAVELGRFAGEQVFAREIGPIRLTLDGVGWELAWYE